MFDERIQDLYGSLAKKIVEAKRGQRARQVKKPAACAGVPSSSKCGPAAGRANTKGGKNVKIEVREFRQAGVQKTRARRVQPSREGTEFHLILQFWPNGNCITTETVVAP